MKSKRQTTSECCATQVSSEGLWTGDGDQHLLDVDTPLMGLDTSMVVDTSLVSTPPDLTSEGREMGCWRRQIRNSVDYKTPSNRASHLYSFPVHHYFWHRTCLRWFQSFHDSIPSDISNHGLRSLPSTPIIDRRRSSRSCRPYMTPLCLTTK